MQTVDLYRRVTALNEAIVALQSYPWEALDATTAAPVEGALAALQAEFNRYYRAYQQARQAALAATTAASGEVANG